MGAIHISDQVVTAAIDRVLSRALEAANVAEKVQEKLQELVTEAVEKIEDEDIWDELRTVLDRADASGGVLERWLDRYRDELIREIANQVVTRLFSDPGGPSLFREDVLDTIAVKVITDGTETEV